MSEAFKGAAPLVASRGDVEKITEGVGKVVIFLFIFLKKQTKPSHKDTKITKCVETRKPQPIHENARIKRCCGH